MKIYTADRETGTFIEECGSIEEARTRIAAYEEQDRQNGEFEEGFYSIVDENHCIIVYTDVDKNGNSIEWQVVDVRGRKNG